MFPTRISFDAGDLTGAVKFLGQSLWKDTAPIRLNLAGEPVYVRPGTPDIAVAKSCLTGEFDAAIEAARPLKYNFIVDAGGYIGTAALAFAKAFPEATIVSIEPSIDNFAVMNRNNRLNTSNLRRALAPREIPKAPRS